LPPFATSLVQARSFQTISREQNYITDIGVPKHPLTSGPSTWVTFNENNHCTIQLQNCAPHEIGIETGDMLGIVDTETMTPIPLDDDSLATKCTNDCPKSRRKHGPGMRLRKGVILEHRKHTEAATLALCSGTKLPSA